MHDDIEGPAPAAAPSDGKRGRNALIFALLVAAGVVAVFLGRGRIPPRMSPTLEHAASLGSRDPGACLACHRPEGAARPRPAGHTPSHDCGSCHLLRER